MSEHVPVKTNYWQAHRVRDGCYEKPHPLLIACGLDIQQVAPIMSNDTVIRILGDNVASRISYRPQM